MDGYTEQSQPYLAEQQQQGQWGPQISAMYDDVNNSVQCLEYDSVYERLWVGHKSGRVMSLSYKENEQTLQVKLERYSSFMCGNKEGVRALQPVQDFLISAVPSTLRMHTEGGIGVGTIKAQEMIMAPGSPTEKALFSCFALYTNTMLMTDVPPLPSHAIAGTNKNIALAYDLSTFNEKPLLTYDVKVASETVVQEGSHLAIGGNDGKVRLLDGRLRSSTVQHTMNAHSGPILDICIQPNDVTMFTCGKVSRDINPHDPNSPKRTSPDPLVRVFDLRMNRQIAPLTMQTASPNYIKFVPASSAQGGYGSKILLVSSTGHMQVLDPLAALQGVDSDSESIQYLYASLQTPRDTVTAAAVSSSGQVLCTGTYSGCISQFALGMGDPNMGRVVNEVSGVVPPYREHPPKPLLSNLKVDTDGLSTVYTLNVNDKTQVDTLSSAYYQTPKLLNKPVKLFPKQIVSHELLKDIKKSDFIGFIPNPGFKPNSMLNAGIVEGKRAYAVCDPRKKIESEERGADSYATLATSSSSSSLDDSVVTLKRVSSLLAGGEGDLLAVGASGVGNVPGGYNISPHYQRQRSYRGKQRINRFNYAALNPTYLIALENMAPNSYTNTVLQYLLAIPAVRKAAIASQASLYHHSNPHTLWCELGFLFHMMQSIERQVKDEEGMVVEEESTHRVVTPSNFQRTFQCIPEAVAMGLFDGSLGSVQALVQTFLRFFFLQLHRESTLEASRANTSTGGAASSTSKHLPGSPGSPTSTSFRSLINDIFGFSIVSVTRFMQSGAQETGIPNQAFTFDLVYPPTGATKKKAASGEGVQSRGSEIDESIERNKLPPGEPKPAGTPASFAAAVWGSLRKETAMKGWCEASKSYEPFRQVRSMVTLPQVLTLLCGETHKDPVGTTISGALGEVKSQGSMHDVYWSSRNSAGGSWLPLQLQVSIFRPEDPTAASKLVVSALMTGEENGEEEQWVIYDGASEKVAKGPASTVQGYGISAPVPDTRDPHLRALPQSGWTTRTLELSAVISQVNAYDKAPIAHQHAILHARRGRDVASREVEPKKGWVLCNDLCLRYTHAEEVVTFEDWRHPCAVFYTQIDYGYGVTSVISRHHDGPSAVSVPASVLQLPSVSTVPCVRLASVEVPDKGQIVAFDGEFVSVALEQAETSADGQKVLVQEARQNLARYSLVHGGTPGDDQCSDEQSENTKIVADDYIIPSETIVDYLTRFSGIVAEDLQPAVSRSAVVPNRTAYLKLRFFVDSGCIFVGHGLDKDFDTANIFVPREQVIDTVELWRLPNQRKMSLRFLAAYVLKEDIQDEIHDSIEDAKTALFLYRTYQAVAAKGYNHLQSVLQEMYAYGTKSNWSIRQELIEEHFAHSMLQIEIRKSSE